MLQSLLEASQRGGLARRSLSKAEIDEQLGRRICGVRGIEGTAQVAHRGRGRSLAGGAASGLLKRRHRPRVSGRSREQQVFGDDLGLSSVGG